MLAALWNQYSFEKRRALIDYLVKQVVVDVMSTHWLRIQVTWIHEEWGNEEVYYHRCYGGRRDWRDEDEEILRKHYETMPKDQLMALLPNRGWQAIMQRAQFLGIKRGKDLPILKDDSLRGVRKESLADLEFMRENNIPIGSTKTTWRIWFVRFLRVASQGRD